ncbi:hypothetical protein C1879_04210 [Paraeggerthella hongkongensis]|nr:hypothetical protein C1879_04210 [Paraeggerthella hongkongensis]
MSQLKAAGITYVNKRLESRVANWEKIIDLLESENLLGVIWKASRKSYENFADPEYKDTAIKLAHTIAKKPHVAFVHESYIIGHPYEGGPPSELFDDDYDFWYYNLQPPANDVRKWVNEFLSKSGVDLTPYQKNAEMSVIAANFVENHKNNMVFRAYIPSSRMWSKEADKLLSLFRDYLHSIKGFGLRQEKQETGQGIVYEFFADKAINIEELSKEFEDFDDLLQYSVSKPEQAMQILQDHSISSEKASEIITRYAKEVRRLDIDLKHERETRILTVRHRLESELIDTLPHDIDWQSINRLIDCQIPKVKGLTNAIGLMSSYSESKTNMTVNLNPQIIEQVNGVVAQQIIGDQNFGTDVNQILELISKYGGYEKDELLSAVYELEDENAKSEGRLVARQKLKAFLFKVMGKVSDAGIAVGIAYLNSQLGI